MSFCSCSLVYVAARRVLLAATLVLAAAPPAAAAPIDCGEGSPLDVLISLGADGCKAGHRTSYYDFSYSVAGGGGAKEPAPSEISVWMLGGCAGEGVLFESEWRVGPGQTLDILLGYSFTPMLIDGGASMYVDADVSFPGEPGPPFIETTICLFATGLCQSGVRLELPRIKTGGRVEMTVHLDGDANYWTDGGLVTQIFNDLAVPEPSTLVLAVMALGAGALRRRVRR